MRDPRSEPKWEQGGREAAPSLERVHDLLELFMEQYQHDRRIATHCARGMALIAAQAVCASRPRVLTVGDGDLSYSLALARAFGDQIKLTATVLLSEAEVVETYAAATRCIAELRERGVDMAGDATTEHLRALLEKARASAPEAAAPEAAAPEAGAPDEPEPEPQQCRWQQR